MAQVAPEASVAAYAPPPVYVTLSDFLPPPPTARESSADEVVELDRHVFAQPVRRDILHLCVVHHLDGLRQGSANTKTRGEVRGSGRKIRPQKGTGHARLGDGQSPMLRGGGVAFGPRPRDFSTELPRKVRALGMRVALSARIKDASLGIVRALDTPGARVAALRTRSEKLGWGKTLFVTGCESVPYPFNIPNADLAGHKFVAAKDLDVYTLVKWPRVVLDLAAVELLERNLGKVAPRPLEITALGAPPTKEKPAVKGTTARTRSGRKRKWAQPLGSTSAGEMYEPSATA
jgi:large subunit ribosomal protein L4